jgi:Bacterial protein of unknown function (DUF924)
MSREHPEVGHAEREAEEVLSYWFPEDINNADPETRRRQGERWMHGGPEVDREITERFGELLERARGGELDHWADTPRGRLALIIVLDQFSRNIYRGSPLSYSQDKKALKLALEGIDLRMDRELGTWSGCSSGSRLATPKTSPSTSVASATPRRKRPTRHPTSRLCTSSGSPRPGQHAAS